MAENTLTLPVDSTFIKTLLSWVEKFGSLAYLLSCEFKLQALPDVTEYLIINTGCRSWCDRSKYHRLLTLL